MQKMPALWKCSIGLIVVLSIAMQLDAVTVNPLCPTNKIAPHRRTRRFKNQPRTFHAYYDLLRPDSSYDVPSSMQEQPQEDDPADCGQIEDYDENDVSSVSTSHSTRRQGHRYINKYGDAPPFFNNYYGYLTRPTIPPKRPTRPPSGGYFGNNAYNPPRPLKPTAHLKPVREDGHEPHMTYRPGLVGAPSGHIIGLPQVKPTRHYPETTTHKKHVNQIRDTTTQTNKQIQRKPNRPPGLIGSFIDLLF